MGDYFRQPVVSSAARRDDHIVLTRPSTGTIWILRNENGLFKPVYNQGDPGSGIGGYDLRSAGDRVFPFDYDHSGNSDHLALYRPGTGTIWILRHRNGVFDPVFKEGAPGNGIGGYDLKSGADRIFSFDYTSTGRMDHLVLYRPGESIIWILKNNNGIFTPVYKSWHGIGNYDLKSTADRALAFDYDHTGCLNHIVLHRPGSGIIWILKNGDGVFSTVYSATNGIGGYDLKSTADRIFAFDYDGNGKMDHLVLYRPGTGTIWILANKCGTFVSVYAEGDPGKGIGGYDLKSPADRAFAFDYGHTGQLNYIVLYRPGTGTMWILKKNETDGKFNAVYAQGDPGNGIGGYDLKSGLDRAFAFNYIAGNSFTTNPLTQNHQNKIKIVISQTEL